MQIRPNPLREVRRGPVRPVAAAQFAAGTTTNDSSPERPGMDLSGEGRSPIVDVLADMLSHTICVESVPHTSFPEANSGQPWSTVPMILGLRLYTFRPGVNVPECVLSSVTFESLPCDGDGLGAYNWPTSSPPANAWAWGGRLGRGAAVVVGKVGDVQETNPVPNSLWQQLLLPTFYTDSLLDGQAGAMHLSSNFIPRQNGNWTAEDLKAHLQRYKRLRIFRFPPGLLSDARPVRTVTPKSFGALGLRVAQGEELGVWFCVPAQTMLGTTQGGLQMFMDWSLTMDFAPRLGGTPFATK
jgi:hypothetical protein